MVQGPAETFPFLKNLFKIFADCGRHDEQKYVRDHQTQSRHCLPERSNFLQWNISLPLTIEARIPMNVYCLEGIKLKTGKLEQKRYVCSKG